MAYFPRANMTRLIRRSGDIERCALRKECAAREAVARGLKEYMEQLRHEGVAGRVIEFKDVRDTYGDLWTPAHYPSVNIHGGIGDADYDSAKTSGGSEILVQGGPKSGESEAYDMDRVGDPPPPSQKFYYFSPSTFEVDLTVDVWSSDDAQRKMIDLMLEDDFNPTPDFLGGGFRLELPHYCNARADFHLKGSSIAYEAAEAKRGVYRAQYKFLASLDLRVMRSQPKLIPRISVDASTDAQMPTDKPPSEPV